MIVLEHSEDRERGTWKAARTTDGRKTANVICPDCGTLLHLDPHIVGTDGVVSPSVVCHGCEFHAFVSLGGWIP